MNLVWENGPDDRSEFMISLALADWADDKGRAFPGIEALARKARCSVRTVQETLKEMKKSGLISIETNAGPSGTNRYTINLEMLVAIGNDRNSGGAETAPPQKLHPADHDEKGAQNAYADCTRTIKNHHRNPQDAHARVREADDPCPDFGHGSASPDEEQPEDRRLLRRAFQALVNGWPGFQGLSLEGAWKQYQALTPQERQDAARRKDAWIKLLRSQGKDHTPVPSTYFRERLWEAVPDRIETPASQQMAAPFGKLWSYHVLKLLKAPPIEPPPPSAFIRQVIEGGGEAARRAIRDRKAAYGWPQVNRILEAAMDGRGCAASAAETAELPEMEAVEKNSRTFDAWRIAFSEAGLPFMRVPDQVQFVWLPKAGPSEWAGAGTGPSPAPTACGPGGPRARASETA